MMPSTSENVAQYYSALASQYKLNYISLENTHMDASLLKQTECSMYLKLQAIPINETNTTITIATSNPTDINIEKIKNFWKNKKIKIVLIARQDITLTLANRFKKKYTHDITYRRFDMDPIHSASFTFSLAEKIIIITSIALLGISLFLHFKTTLFYVHLFLSFGTVIIMAYKLGLTIRLARWPQKKLPKIKQEDNALPMYTVLIPLLREKEVTITVLLESLQRLDYPADKLDIKLLLEEDDSQTLEVIQKFSLPWYYEVLIVPPGLPLSKPRACNYGLYLAFGEYLTIYDAEDKPDADQLKKSLECFLENDEDTVCIQAALNFYNYKENILTRLFTIEYSHWFDSLVPALVFLRAPVPLGGTSNHFKTPILLKLGGWDPYIGTEDAEIGVRIYRNRYKTKCIISTTYEEANTNFLNWFKQRARWNKGYMQTYLVNMRDPINMIKQMGMERFINFQLFVGGNVFIQLANLPLWFFLIAIYFQYMTHGLASYPKLLFFITLYNFLFGNFLLLISEFYAVYRRRLYCLLPYVPLKIFYWFLMSFAGYYAIIELLVRPGYWYKTEHGISEEGKNTDVQSQ